MGRHGGNQLRIIGGVFGRRRLRFPDLPGLRPTPDRVRETLFNWLRDDVPGARCLDLFAGSGALGLEALSRGAAEVVFVERAKAAAEALRENIRILDCADRARVLPVDAERWLRQPTVAGPFDLVFLDPPFKAGLLDKALSGLLEQELVAPGAAIYLEQDSSHAWSPLPPGWAVSRESHAGQSAQRLLRAESTVGLN